MWILKVTKNKDKEKRKKERKRMICKTPDELTKKI